jgi:List-Bact-rpt repeat protein
MKCKLISLLTVMAWMFFIQGNLSAQETDVDSAVLTMKTFGPVAAGTVDPVGVWIVLKNGETVNISATANAGFTFSSWTISGLGTIADSTSAVTSVTLTGNAVVTANFIQDGNTLTADLSVSVSPDSSGSVTPATTETINIGQIQEITATPAATYKFLKWSVEGAATFDDVYSATTNVVIRGPVSIKALFAETAETAELTLEAGDDDAGGSILITGTYSVEKGESMKIQAVPESGYIFTGWDVDGLAVLDSEYASKTNITIYDDTTVSATFAAFVCTYSHARRKIIIRKTDGSSGYRQNADYVNVKFLPMCLNSNDFDPLTDTIEVLVDGDSFTIDKDQGRFLRNQHGYKYRSFERSGGSSVRFSLDFTRGVWSFIASRINLEILDNSDGVDITMYVNGNYYGRKYDMEEKVTWRFDIKRNKEEDVDSPETEMDSYKISRIRGRFRNDKDGKDFLVIPKAAIKLPANTTFDPATQMVTLNIGNESIIIPVGSFEEIKTNKFLYNNKEQKIRLTLDLEKETWSLTYRKFSGWGNIDAKTGLKVYLDIGVAQSGINIVPSFRRTLKYNYNRFYWRR